MDIDSDEIKPMFFKKQGTYKKSGYTTGSNKESVESGVEDPYAFKTPQNNQKSYIGVQLQINEILSQNGDDAASVSIHSPSNRAYEDIRSRNANSKNN